MAKQQKSTRRLTGEWTQASWEAHLRSMDRKKEKMSEADRKAKAKHKGMK